jgi:hypothetical protein
MAGRCTLTLGVVIFLMLAPVGGGAAAGAETSKVLSRSEEARRPAVTTINVSVLRTLQLTSDYSAADGPEILDPGGTIMSNDGYTRRLSSVYRVPETTDPRISAQHSWTLVFVYTVTPNY